jgi:serine/threonine protein kinase
MLTTDLGACEWFVWDLRRSNLIDRGQLDQVIGEFLAKNPGAEPPQLSEFLISKDYLTDFQAERLLQGKTQGFVLGPFTLMDALGAGSMGTVYKAHSKTDTNWYAVKVLPRRSMWNVRIARRKVRLFEQIQHLSVVPFIDVGTAGGMHYLAWPLVEGTTLDKIVAEQGKLAPELTIQYALQTAEGLHAAHQASLFHGLLKPSNLMIGPDGQVKILDFGIGCLLAETEGESLVDTMSTANSVNSGLDCSSPESIMDPTNLNAVGDQYSLGCVIYYCLTGQYPFPDGTAVEKMMCHQHKQPTPVLDINPHVPEEYIPVVERLMQKSPEARYPSMAEVIEALRALAQPAAPAATQRRQTMQMPRVKLGGRSLGDAGGSIGGLAPPAPIPAPKPAPRVNQPLPARSPSAPAPAPAARNQPGQVARPSDLGRRPPEPAPVPAPARPAPAPRAAAQRLTPPRPAASAPAEDYEPTPEHFDERENAPAPAFGRGEARFGPVAVVLIALLASAAAFFLSRMIPM